MTLKIFLKKLFLYKSLLLIVLIFLSLFFHKLLFGQKLVQDTLKLSFEPLSELKSVPVKIDSVIDQRQELPRVLGIYEKNKYLFVPVDLIICTEKPLNREIFNIFQKHSNYENYQRVMLGIDEFKLSKKTNSWLYPHYRLNVFVSLYNMKDNNEQEYAGQLLYECSYRKSFFKDKLKKGFERVIQKWQQELLNDLSLREDKTSAQLQGMENFRAAQYNGKPVNMFTNVDFIVSKHGEMIDGEIFFSPREARKCIFRSGGYHLRHRNAKDFESVEFGLSNDYLFYRFHLQMALRVNSQIMLGVNRWKDIKTVDHKIYDALIADYSLSQSLIYNPLDKRSLIVGIGVQENVFYVYSKDFLFDVGLLIHLGLKL